MVDRFCVPYINPDVQAPDLSAISLSFLIPSCCKPPFRCPSEFDTIYGETRFLVRYLNYAAELDWNAYIGWFPFFGPLIADQLLFPHGKPPSYGWYCFAISTASIVEALFWSLLLLVCVIAWILPLTLMLWCCTSWCCISFFTLIRCCCFCIPTCRPKYAREPQYRKDINSLRAALGTIPGFGGCTPKFMKNGAGGGGGGGGGGGFSSMLNIGEMIDNGTLPVVAGPAYLFGPHFLPTAAATHQEDDTHTTTASSWNDIESNANAAHATLHQDVPQARSRRHASPPPSYRQTTQAPPQAQPQAQPQAPPQKQQQQQHHHSATPSQQPTPQTHTTNSIWGGKLPMLPDVEASAILQQAATSSQSNNVTKKTD